MFKNIKIFAFRLLSIQISLHAADVPDEVLSKGEYFYILCAYFYLSTITASCKTISSIQKANF